MQEEAPRCLRSLADLAEVLWVVKNLVSRLGLRSQGSPLVWVEIVLLVEHGRSDITPVYPWDTQQSNVTRGGDLAD